MPGFILNAIGSAAGAAGDIYGEERRAETNLNNQKAAADYSSQLEMRRQEAIQRLKLENIPLEAKARDEAEAASQAASAERFNKARDGIINKRVDAALGPEFQGNASVMNDRQVADIERMSTERKAKGEKIRESMRNDPSVMREAGLESGQISPKEAATMAGSADIAKLRMELQGENNETKRLLIDAQIRALEAKAAAAGNKSDGNINREERIRYTTLFTDAGRRLGEAQKALAKVMPGRAGDAERAQLTEAINQYKSERDLYQGMLAGSQAPSGDKPAATPAQSNKPKAPPSITGVKGAPSGSTMGSFVSGKGWEVRDSKGKVIGYAQE